MPEALAARLLANRRTGIPHEHSVTNLGPSGVTVTR